MRDENQNGVMIGIGKIGVPFLLVLSLGIGVATLVGGAITRESNIKSELLEVKINSTNNSRLIKEHAELLDKLTCSVGDINITLGRIEERLVINNTQLREVARDLKKHDNDRSE